MKVKMWMSLLSFLLGVLLIVGGCREKAEEVQPEEEVKAPVEESIPQEEVQVEESKPVEEVQVEEEKVDLLKIRETAMKEKEAILAKQDEVKKLIEEKSKIPVTEQLGEESKNITQKIEELNNAIKEHTERYNGYMEQLKAGNVDVSELEM